MKRISLTLSLLLWAADAEAQEEAGEAPESEWSCEEQSPILDRAKALASAQDFAGALRIWESVVARCGEAESLRALYNIGLAHKELGNANVAMARYLRFLELAEPLRGQSEGIDTAIQSAKDAMGELRASHGEIVVTGSPGRKVMITIDGAAGPPVPGRWLVAPGKHRVRLTVDGKRETERTLSVERGRSYYVVPRPPPRKVEVYEPPFPTVTVALLWTAAGVLATGGAVAHGFAAAAEGDAADIAVEPVPTMEQRAQHEEYADTNRAASIAAVVGYGLGAVVGAVALGVTIAAASQEPTARIGLGGHGLWIEGRF